MKKVVLVAMGAALALTAGGPAMAGGTNRGGNQPTHTIWGGSGSGGWAGKSSSGGMPTGSSGNATSVPEPGDILLFAAGVSGLLIGRRSSRRRSDA